MKKSLALVGMMGCGKTTCGRLLAEKTGLPLVDTDEIIVQQAGCSITEIFATHGETYFRDLETAVLREACRGDGQIITTGGGAILRRENREVLREHCTVVFLNRSPKEIFETVSMEGRPLGQGGQTEFLRTFARRDPLYRAAAHYIIFDFASPQGTVEEILNVFRKEADR